MRKKLYLCRRFTEITLYYMKKLFILMFLCLMAMTAQVWGQSADQIVGSYKAIQNGVTSKVKIFKHNGGYRAQVFWVDNLVMEDGSKRLDPRNPDPAKRNVQADQIVIIDKVTYDAKEKMWCDGKIYDPTSGKVYKVEITFKDEKTLQLKGMLGPFFKRVYWTKL